MESEGSIFDKDGAPIYGLWKNAMFTSFPRRSSKYKGSTSRLRWAALFGTPLIFDVSLTSNMNRPQCKTIANQIREAYLINRYSSYPYDLWIVNLKPASLMDQCLFEKIENLRTRKDHFITITSEHYLEHFDRKQLVYLTSDGRNEITKIDHNAIFILGASFGGQGLLLKAKALRDRVAHKKLPLDVMGIKAQKETICLNHVVDVLCKAKDGFSLRDAIIQGLPKRMQHTPEKSESLHRKRRALQVRASNGSLNRKRSLLLEDMRL